MVSNSSKPVIIIGTGPVGIRFVTELRKHNLSQPIVIFGNEPWQPYNRVKLSSLLANELAWDEITSKDWHRIEHDPHTQTHLNCPITSIDKDKKIVVDVHGNNIAYSELVIATGSRPYRPNIKGNRFKGVYTFRDLNDVQALLARQTRSRHVCVLGGGLLGLETAKALSRHNTQVTIIQRAFHLMNNQLDEIAANRLKETVTDMGIAVQCGLGVVEILGEGLPGEVQSVAGIVLRDGSHIECDTVVFATGIVPNNTLALNAGLSIAKGIKVNNDLQTSDPFIYAIGECAEHEGKTYGLVAPGFEQAAVAARHVNKQDDHAQYLGSTTATELKVIGQSVFSVGAIEKPRTPFSSEHQYFEEDAYRKIIVDKGQIIGAQAIGPWLDGRRIQEMITQKRRVWPWQLLRFRLTGSLFSESENKVEFWPDETLVCQCMAVTKGRLNQCIKSGCTKISALGEQTGAGTVCGSCKPLLADLLGSEEKEPDPKWLVLLQTCTMSLILSFIFLLLPTIAYSTTVQGINVDQLWIDSTYKQITGFSLLSLSIFIILLSLRKRFKPFQFLSYPLWRVLHTAFGIVLLMVLITHTGLQLGSNLNFALMMSYLSVSLVGVVTGLSVALEHKMSRQLASNLKKVSYWGHLLSSWPIPALLTFHITSVYYF